MAEEQGDWKSGAVVLALMGASFGLSQCEQPEYRRNGYTTASDCVKDYNPEQCEAANGHDADGFYNGTSVGYYGPWYQPRRTLPVFGDPGPGRTALNGVSQAAHPAMSATSRGGFGSTGRASGYRGG
jgi:uncharacterized protein YgiB involved in biofilm formation